MSSLIPLLSLVAMTAMNASAQTAPAAALPQATSSTYRSAFEGYRPFVQERLLPWQETNDTVGKIGGWRAYAREASVVQPAPVHGKH